MDFETLINSLNFTNVFWQIGATFIFNIVDIVSGIIQACINNNLDSKVMRQGLLRKILVILVVILSFILENAFGINWISKGVCIYVILMEIISIGENLKKAGIDLGKLGEILKVKKEDED